MCGTRTSLPPGMCRTRSAFRWAGQFASWAGAVLGLSADPVLIGETAEQISEARLRLARVGIEDVAGYLEGGIAAWKAAGLPLAQVPQVTVQELKAHLDRATLRVLDVRREGEWNAGHIEGASWHALDNFKRALPEARSRCARRGALQGRLPQHDRLQLPAARRDTATSSTWLAASMPGKRQACRWPRRLWRAQRLNSLVRSAPTAAHEVSEHVARFCPSCGIQAVDPCARRPSTVNCGAPLRPAVPNPVAGGARSSDGPARPGVA